MNDPKKTQVIGHEAIHRAYVESVEKAAEDDALGTLWYVLCAMGLFESQTDTRQGPCVRTQLSTQNELRDCRAACAGKMRHSECASRGSVMG